MNTTDYLDLPDGFKVTLPITFRDRINGECLDPHHCTIANAVIRLGASMGIIELGRRGISRTLVGLILDPKVYPWAKPGQEYRGRLTNHSAALAVELDDWHERNAQHKRHKTALRRMAAKTPNGLDTTWDSITIVPPKPSQQKGYRAGSSGVSRSGPKPAVKGAPARRYKGRPKAA